MADPLISVIVPTYGRPEFLAEALASIKAQSYGRWEVIVVDDCSPQPVDVPDWVTLIRHKRNQGGGPSRNTGVAHADGDWVLFLDDDDLLEPDRLQWAVDGMGDARMHACRAVNFYPDGRTTEKYVRLEGDLSSVRARHQEASLCQIVFHREDLVQFADLRLGFDTEWWYRMADRCHFAWTDEIGHRFRQDGTERPFINAEVAFQCRKAIVGLHADAMKVDRWFYADRLRRVGSMAYLAGRRSEAAKWTARSLCARPTVAAAKLLALTLGGH